MQAATSTADSPTHSTVTRRARSPIAKFMMGRDPLPSQDETVQTSLRMCRPVSCMPREKSEEYAAWREWSGGHWTCCVTGGRAIVWIVHRELRSLCESGLGVRNGGEGLGMSTLWVGRGLWVSLWQGLEGSQKTVRRGRVVLSMGIRRFGWGGVWGCSCDPLLQGCVV